MKLLPARTRLFRGAVLLGFGAAILPVLIGCPIYSADRGRVCTASGCYECPDDYYSNECVNWNCRANSDCPNAYVCSSGQCRLPPTYDSGVDCTQTGCPTGSTCTLRAGSFTCVANPVTSTDSGTPDSSATECQRDNQCTDAGTGAKCLEGSCIAAVDQCSDATQCSDGFQCVQGVCTPSCSQTKACPTGFACDLSKGVCTQNPNPCTTPSQCTGGTTCVQEHCVPVCGQNADANACPDTFVCVAGGCLPKQKPQFVCTTEGANGTGQSGSCAIGSVCLHHNCYIGCSPDAGTNACVAADKFNVCKAVSTASGSFSVCGSAGNLGTDCDPTQGKNCSSGAICIDGFCR